MNPLYGDSLLGMEKASVVTMVGQWEMWTTWTAKPHNICKKWTILRQNYELSIFLKILLIVESTEEGQPIMHSCIIFSQTVDVTMTKKTHSWMHSGVFCASNKHSYFYIVSAWFCQPLWTCRTDYLFIVKL